MKACLFINLIFMYYSFCFSLFIKNKKVLHERCNKNFLLIFVYTFYTFLFFFFFPLKKEYTASFSFIHFTCENTFFFFLFFFSYNRSDIIVNGCREKNLQCIVLHVVGSKEKKYGNWIFDIGGLRSEKKTFFFSHSFCFFITSL